MRRRTGWLAGRQAGFSMIETLFVLIILGVMAGLAMPVMERGVTRSKADRAAATIGNDLRNAFSLAARQRKPVRILISTANRTITIQDRASGTVFVHRNLSNQSEYGLTSMAVNRTALDVFPNGLASDTLTIRYNVGANNGRAVRMTRVGQIRMQ